MGLRDCRFCAAPLEHTMVDLGMSPPSEAFLPADKAFDMEKFYPLDVLVCSNCFLAQVPAYVDPEEIFDDYAYFSSYSTSWLEHSKRYTDAMTDRFGLGSDSFVVEVASNDGYLLQYFVEKDIPCLGIEPARTVADAAEERGVPTRRIFFNESTARDLASEGRFADLMIGNNVIAQVTDLNGFMGGFRHLLAPAGVVTLEFPHLVTLIAGNQFDTIYHEHYSYLSIVTLTRIAEAHGLDIFDIEKLPTHGGSLRVFFQHADGPHAHTPAVAGTLAEERAFGLDKMSTYTAFGERAVRTKRRLLEYLLVAQAEGRRVAGYGAPGKGNTLLNYCGIRSDLVSFLVDRNPYKHGRLTPGTHIPIHAPEKIFEEKPDDVLVLPWNLRDEIIEQMRGIGDWGGRFIIPIPEVEVVEP